MTTGFSGSSTRSRRRRSCSPRLEALEVRWLLSHTLPADGTILVATNPSVYHFTTYDVSGSTRTAVNGNSPNAIAGEFDDAGGNTHGFVLSNGVLTQIDVPGAVSTSVNGINANGKVAGTYTDAGGTFHAYFRSNGVFTTLDPSGAVRTQAGFLNAQGQVVGTYRDGDQTRHGFIWSKGVFTTFDVPGAAKPLGTVGFGINDHGEVVGDYVDISGNRHGFVRSHGVYTTLDVPGASVTVAEGINNRGQIAGVIRRCGRQPAWLRVEQRRLHDDRRARLGLDRGPFNQRARRDRGILR